MSELIYLVGQISPKFEESYQWRKNVEDEFAERDDIQIINPCANPFNDNLLKKQKYDIRSDMGVLPPKDLTYILRSTIAIVNLNQYDKDKELLGSYFEMGWLYTHPEKTVIAFADDLNSYVCRHPFVSQTVHAWCNNEYAACDIINEYFSNVRL